jgi:hypothetical protein
MLWPFDGDNVRGQDILRINSALRAGKYVIAQREHKPVRVTGVIVREISLLYRPAVLGCPRLEFLAVSGQVIDEELIRIWRQGHVVARRPEQFAVRNVAEAQLSFGGVDAQTNIGRVAGSSAQSAHRSIDALPIEWKARAKE